uniref:Subtilisin inhibitor 1 n=1 Tax=Kalanchoe fedtschenkoi TaxID=63787 RepID=A0A7N0RHC4_KALFE
MSENSQQIKGSDPPPPPIPVDLGWEALMGSKNREPAKKTWPELVGTPAGEAERKVKEEMEGANIFVVPADAFVTADYRTDRVRLYVDGAGNVVRPPRIG